ncbi:MAG: spore coat protein U domain-containing protein [Deltaproteobacteria bacterium]|nr:spore coat protein U domain-containing protein [Deltaproteobacteria bacterium]
MGSCTNISAGDVAFGVYDPNNASNTDITSTLTYTCLNLVGTISLSKGNTGTYAGRKMAGSYADSLTYNLYTDPGRNFVWGDGTGGTATVAILLGTALSNTIYGRLFSGQAVSAGTYTDTITVTFNF